MLCDLQFGTYTNNVLRNLFLKKSHKAIMEATHIKTTLKEQDQRKYFQLNDQISLATRHEGYV